MRYISATQIFSGKEFFDKNTVLVIDDTKTITDIISGDSIEPSKIETYEGIITPGFVNAHCHLELSHLKGLIPEKTGLVDFVFKIITERHFAAEVILTAIETAENEMLRNGIVAVGDICNSSSTIAQKSKQRLHYHNFIEVAGFVPAGANSRFATAIEIQKQFQSTMDHQLSTVSPHAPYSVSPELFKLIDDLPDNNLITIHNQESAVEDEFFKSHL